MEKFIKICDSNGVPWIVNTRRIVAIRPGDTVLPKVDSEYVTVLLNEGTKIKTNTAFSTWYEWAEFPKEDK